MAEKKKLNVGLVAHVDAGKTTLSEALLFQSGVLRKMGRVDHQDAFLDTDIQERERGITIFSKLARLTLPNADLTLVDTPGHVDFSTEMERTLQVLDAAVLVISASDGIQSHTRTLWQLLEHYQIPVFLFVNKMDLSERTPQELIRELSRHLDERCVSFLAPVDEEELSLCDEELLSEFLETQHLSEETLSKAIASRHVFPVYFGSALRGRGVEELLSALERYVLPAIDSGSFSARVYKIGRDTRGVRLTFLKLTGGLLTAKMSIADPAVQNASAKVEEIRLYSGAKYESVSEVRPGTICAVTGLDFTFPGQGLGAEKDSVSPVLESYLNYEVQITDGSEIHTVLTSFRILEEEDPSLHVLYDEEKKSISLQLMGVVQLEVLTRMMWERFHLGVRFGEGRIVYRETIAAPVEGVGHYEPLRHYAEVHLLMEPLESGSGLQFDTQCPEEVLAGNFQRLVLTHLEEKEHRGVLTRSPITDMKITLVAGRSHEKHTEGGDFRQATYRAVREGLMKAHNILLEPYYAFELHLPSSALGRALTDLERMHARFEAPETVGNDCVITGTAPVASMQNYSRELVSYTKGLGSLICRFHSYEPALDPESILAAHPYQPQTDLANPVDSVFCSHGAGFLVPWYRVAEFMHLPALDPLPQTQVRRSAKSFYYLPPQEGEVYLEKNASQSEPEFSKEEEKPAVHSGPVRSSGRGLGADALQRDKELMEIFERTYGKISRKEFEPQKKKKGSARTDDTREHVEVHLPQPRDRYLLVDGYNIIHAWKRLEETTKLSYEAARTELQDALVELQGFTGEHVILVYDAYLVKGGAEHVMDYHGISVVFTKEAETADTYIERSSYELRRKDFLVRVATSDGPVQMIVMGNDVLRVTALELEQEVLDVQEAIRSRLAAGNRTFRTGSVKQALADSVKKLGKQNENRKE